MSIQYWTIDLMCPYVSPSKSSTNMLQGQSKNHIIMKIFSYFVLESTFPSNSANNDILLLDTRSLKSFIINKLLEGKKQALFIFHFSQNLEHCL